MVLACSWVGRDRVSVANGRMSESEWLQLRDIYPILCWHVGSTHLGGKQLISHFLPLHCDLSDGPIGFGGLSDRFLSSLTELNYWVVQYWRTELLCQSVISRVELVLIMSIGYLLIQSGFSPSLRAWARPWPSEDDCRFLFGRFLAIDLAQGIRGLYRSSNDCSLGWSKWLPIL